VARLNKKELFSMHVRKHVSAAVVRDREDDDDNDGDERKVQVVQQGGEVVIPSVRSLSPLWQSWLAERQTLNRIKEAYDLQKAKLKPLTADIKAELQHKPKYRSLFHIEKTLEDTYGACAGLRVAKRSRPEAFSEKRLEEVTINAVAIVFQSRFSPEELAEGGKRVCDEMLKQRKRNDVFSVEIVSRKGVGKAHKRQKKEQ
jgi:hypothetical protein